MSSYSSASLQNIKFAARQLLRNPGFTATVILTLALAIGANTAIFSLVNALLLRNLPYPNPERVGAIYARTTGADASDEQIHIDGARWESLRDQVPSLIVAASGFGLNGVNLQAGQQIQYLHSGRVSAHYFDALGIHPLLGRAFSESEDIPHAAGVALLSNSLWRTTFHADPAIIGQTILLKGQAHTVIGVLPATPTPLNADLYTALQPSRDGEGGGTNYHVITRLRDNATWLQANAEINRAWATYIQRFQQHNPGASLIYYSVPLQQGQTDALRPQVLILMLAAGFILLIACANLAGLTLVRMMRRTSEIATRLALGATRWHIQRQLWIENLLLALTAGIISIGVGFLALRGLLALLPENYLPIASVPLDARVLGFTLLVALGTSILFGMLPALTTRRVDLRSSIASRTLAGRGSLHLRQALITLEVALTVVLLAGSGLLIRTLVHLQTLPPGFTPTGVMSAKASLDDARYHDPAAFQKLLNQSTAAMRQIPGVASAAVGLTLPYERALNDNTTLRDGPQAGHEILTAVIYVTPGYFQTLQIPLLAGRDFSASDDGKTESVAIVNQTFARKFFPNQSPIGHYISKATRIIGVAGDVVGQPSLNPGAPLMNDEAMYIPATQMDPKGLALIHTWFQPSWIVRTNHPIEGLTAQMQRALASADPNLPFSGFYSMNDLLASTLATQRIEVALLSAMAGLALLLSALGIFALVANMVAQRTREIGLRIALGSTIRQAMLHIGSTGIVASALGMVLGLGLSAATLRTMASVLYGVGVYDLPTLTAVILTLAAITLLATAIPTLRIARIDPAITLREE